MVKILGLIAVFSSLFCNIEDLCKTIINRFPSWAWYKPTGSSNFSPRDPRVNVLTVELHQRARRTISVRPQCLTLYDNSGQPIAKFGFHSEKREYWARYNGNVRCRQRVPRELSGNIDGCQLYSRLKARGQKSPSVWAKFGDVCYKIEDVRRCGWTSTDPKCRDCRCKNGRFTCPPGWRRPRR